MASLLADSRIVLSAKKISRRSRFLLTFFMLLFFVIIWFFFFYFPLSEAIIKQEHLQKNLLDRINVFQKTLKNFKEIERESLDLERYSKSVLKKSAFQNCMNGILNFVQKNDLLCSGLRPVDIKNHDFYKKEYFEITVKGAFVKIFSFLDDLKKYDRSLKFKKVALYKDIAGDILLDAKLRVVTL